MIYLYSNDVRLEVIMQSVSKTVFILETKEMLTEINCFFLASHFFSTQINK